MGVRLAVRDQRGHGAPGLLRPLRPPPRARHDHPPPGRHDPVLRGANRRRAGPDWVPGATTPRTAARSDGSSAGPSTTSWCSTATPRSSGPGTPWESGLAFFGADHVLFGTDFPFDPEKGPGFIRDTIRAMERMRASDVDKAKIYEGNARRLLRLKLG
ncbi:MAG TPA: amidohydrolase family protein [Methylomirabilota bacterium]